MGPDLVVDFDRDGKPIGVELTDPAHVTLETLNQLLGELGSALLTVDDLAPLRAA